MRLFTGLRRLFEKYLLLLPVISLKLSKFPRCDAFGGQTNRLRFQNHSQEKYLQQVFCRQPGNDIPHARHGIEEVFVRQQEQGFAGGGFAHSIFFGKHRFIENFAWLDFA